VLINILNKKGFTLIELTTVIVIVSIVSVLAGMGLVQIANGYLLAKKSVVAAQQAQIALARLTKEFSKIQSITTTTASPVSITYNRYTNEEGPGKDVEVHSVSWSVKEVKIDDDILIGNVKDFKLSYYDTYNGSSSSSHSPLTAIIEIILTIQGYNDADLTFAERVVI
jgi:prepilin-type N-terminal cleavage/methylation domain-containing protein